MHFEVVSNDDNTRELIQTIQEVNMDDVTFDNSTKTVRHLEIYTEVVFISNDFIYVTQRRLAYKML
jgi:hypothetical protein